MLRPLSGLNELLQLRHADQLAVLDVSDPTQAATGSTRRVPLEAIQPTLNATWFGAVGDFDGTTGTDNTDAINNAIAEAGAAGGGTIYLPLGDYLIEGPILMQEFTRLVGAHDGKASPPTPGTTITLAPGSNCNIIENFTTATTQLGIEIINVRLSGDWSNQTSGHGIYLFGGRLCRIQFVTVDRMYEHGIMLEECGTSEVINCWSQNLNGDALRLQSSFDCFISRNQLNTSWGGDALALYASADHNAIIGNFMFTSRFGMLVSGCKQNVIMGNRANTNNLGGISITARGDHTIIGNICYDNGVSGIGARTGISLSNTTDNTVVGNRCLQDNASETWQQYGIELNGASENNVVTNNNIEGNVTAGLRDLTDSEHYNVVGPNPDGNAVAYVTPDTLSSRTLAVAAGGKTDGILNGDFEAGHAFWAQAAGANDEFDIDTVDFHAGAASMRLTAEAVGTKVVQQVEGGDSPKKMSAVNAFKLTVKPGQSYRLHAAGKCEGANVSSISFEQFNDEGDSTGSTGNVMQFVGETSWVERSRAFTIAAGVYFISIELKAEADASTRDVWFDEIHLERLANRNGVTGTRPVVPAMGEQFFDTTLGHPIWWDGANWVDATGATA